MNREERRRFNKKNKTNYTKEQLDAIEFYAKLRSGNIDTKHLSDLKDLPFVHIDPEVAAPNGAEVMIREDLFKRKDIKNPRYIEFVNGNIGKICHISRENADGSLVTLEEDPEKIWLFDIFSDLLFKNEDGKWDVL